MKLICFLATLVLAAAVDWDTETPLDRYVNAPDEHYEYRELNSFEYEWAPGVTSYTLNMTSQKWLDESWTTTPIWWHIQYVNIPDEVRFPNVCLMFIEGGRNNPEVGDPTDNPFFDMVARFASELGVVTTLLKQIPNQSITFTDDPTQKRRSEDSFIAYTWMRFIEDTSNPEILARMPMTKAAVRALDTATSFAREKNSAIDIQDFYVGGGSKRGWTAWTLACVDRRVKVVLPMVMDLLNFTASLHHHYMSFGGWSFAFEPYYNENITQYLDHPNTQLMAQIIDPYAYRERLTMPKLIVAATGDEFFLLDDSHYYYDGLPGPTYMMMCENTHHSLIFHRERILENMVAFFLAQETGFELPQLTWTRAVENGIGSIVVNSTITPQNVYFYHAETWAEAIGGRRDFRVITDDNIHLVWWEEDVAEDLGGNSYRAAMNVVEGEFVGMFVLLHFAGPNGTTIEFTTEVHIIPDEFPFEDCEGIGCWGTLV